MQLALRPQLRFQPAAGRACSRSRAGLRVQALAIPDDYGWVMASAAFTAMVTQWQSVRVVLARRDAGIKYPKMYADGEDEVAMKFNCTQRAHMNTLETLPNALALQMLLGLAQPKTAAGLGLIWAVGRIIYTLGYSTGDPSKRTPGSAVAGLAYLGLMLITLVVGVRTGLSM